VPKENEKDLADIPDNVKKVLEIVPVSSVDEVLEHALVSQLVPIDWDEDEQDDDAPVASGDEDDEHPGLVKH
jgi:ATP-dependent Lon protease